ncbi:MAG TPA: 5-methyltetrahydropteroyltriglutamate--homocysteine S-methyltransferase [Candidatus Binataceae bacterium]|nr:5-methyltetrahydropteroyltriglutamate--homocysteine S-methyltransferase [Candidatus Binataceae bacterium]
MALRSEPPFRADQVGSLRRPEKLKQARERLLGPHDLDHNFGPHDNGELRAIEDECIREVVALQESAGLQSITDGEFRRHIWWSEFLLSLEGVEGNYRGPTTEFRDRAGHAMPAPRISVNGKIRWRKSVNLEPFKFLKSISRQTPKVTMPAPQSLYFATTPDSINRSVYPDLNALWDDLAIAYRAELAALGGAGCTYVQLDEVLTSCLCDERQRAKWRARGDDPEKLLRTYGQTINRLLEGRPPSMRVAIHTCRGNLQGHWLAEGGYDRVAEYLFNEIAVDAFFLEYDSERAGGFEPLRFVPSGKTVVLGLISTKTPELESADQIVARIEAAAKFIPLDQLCLSPQCGFSSNYLGNPVTIDDEKRKLELVVTVARKVWGNA